MKSNMCHSSVKTLVLLIPVALKSISLLDFATTGDVQKPI